MQEGAGTRGPLAGVVHVAGLQLHLPQLDQPRIGGPGEQPGEATQPGAPEHRRVGGRDDPHVTGAGGLQQPADGDAEGVGDAGEGTDARVGSGALDLDDHALTDAGAAGQLVQGPAARVPQRPHVLSNRGDRFDSTV